MEKTITSIPLNNSGDETVNLKDKANALIDSFSYNGTVEGKSFSRIKDGENNWVSETEPTKNGVNQAPPSPSPSPKSSPSPTPSPSPSPTPSPVLSPSPSLKLFASPSPLLEEMDVATGSAASESAATESGEILGETESSESAKNRNPYLGALIMIGLGIGLLGGAGVVFIRGSKYNKSL